MKMRLRAAGRKNTGTPSGALSAMPFVAGATRRRMRAHDVLNFALTLEYLEAEFYTIGVATNGLIPAADRTIFTTIRDHENAHVEFLRNFITSAGETPVAKPTFDFTAGGMFDTFSNYETFKLLAQAFEDTGVRAYKGQAGNLIDDKDVLEAALTIHSVEARHASEVRRLRGLQGWIPFDQPGAPAPVAPVYAGMSVTTKAGVNVTSVSAPFGVSQEDVTEAFDEPLDMEAVLEIAAPFIV